MQTESRAIKLGEIIIDPAIQTRPIDPAWVRQLEEYRAVGDKIAPMLVAPYGKGYVLLGGNHRFEMYKRALGAAWPETTVAVDVKDCADTKEMMMAAVLDNRGGEKPLTESQRNALYFHLTREMGWSKREAKEVIGITAEHAEKYESQLVRMAPTAEQAKMAEKTTKLERAMETKSPANPERAKAGKKTTLRERARNGEKTISTERFNPRTIDFHIQRLREHVPESWKRSREALDLFAEATIEDMKEATNE